MDSANRKIGIIILAAGESKRFAYFPKQLLEFEGQTLLRHTVENALNSGTGLVCTVLGANFERLTPEIEDLPVEIVVNENWSAGMASSLQKGLRKLLELEPDLAAVAVTLGDQPLIKAEILRRLMAAFQADNSSIIAAEYAGTIGVPAIFPSSMFAQLLELKSTEGAKKVIIKNLAFVTKISIPEAAFDIDTREDFESFLETLKSLDQHLFNKKP